MDDILKPGSSRTQASVTGVVPRSRTRTSIPIGVTDSQAPTVTPISSPTPPSASEPVAPISPMPPQTAAEDPEESLQPDTTSTSVKLPVIEPQTDKEVEPEQAGKVTQAPANHAPRKGHWGAIFVAIILALALIAGAGYGYYQNKKNNDDVTKTPVKTTPVVQKDPATREDVTKSTEAIDKAIKTASDVTDSPETDLSDSTLGL